MQTIVNYALAYMAPVVFFVGALALVVLGRAIYEHGLATGRRYAGRRHAERRRGFLL